MSNYDKAIEEADALKVTLNTPGWKIIADLMNNRKSYHTQLLLKEKVLNNILFSQAFIEAIDSITSEIHALIQVGAEAEKINKNKRSI